MSATLYLAPTTAAILDHKVPAKKLSKTKIGASRRCSTNWTRRSLRPSALAWPRSSPISPRHPRPVPPPTSPGSRTHCWAWFPRAGPRTRKRERLPRACTSPQPRPRASGPSGISARSIGCCRPCAPGWMQWRFPESSTSTRSNLRTAERTLNRVEAPRAAPAADPSHPSDRRVLDLLYRDHAGQWRLLDWKTEPVLTGQSLQEAAGPYLRKMAVAELAAEWDALLAESQGGNS